MCSMPQQSTSPPTAKLLLSKRHAQSDNISVEWDQGNEQWWDWYMSLAENQHACIPLQDLPAPAAEPCASVEQLQEELSRPYALSGEQIDAFRQQGYVKLKGVLSRAALVCLRMELCQLIKTASAGSQFSSLEMMWQHNSILRGFALSPRLARIAAELLSVRRVRLYHDNGLVKQPGCGRTPWHYDAHHFPIATANICTLWAPLQPVPRAMGPLAFARGMETYRLVEDIPFNKFDTSYDRQIIQKFRAARVQVDESEFDEGEVSYHHAFSFHTAGPNQTTIPRGVLATTYFEHGACVTQAPHMVNGDWRKFMPGIEAGQKIDTPLNPILETC